MEADHQKTLNFWKRNWLTILLAVVPPLMFWYLLERSNPELTVEIEANVPIIQIDNAFSNEISISYQGSQVQGLRVVEIKLENTGNTPISSADFESPITFRFEAERYTGPELLTTEPSTLSPVISVDSTGLASIAPLLLNPNDLIRVRFVLVDPENPNPIISARIRGVSELTLIGPDTSESAPDFLALLLSVIAGALVAALSGSSLLRLSKELRLVSIKLPGLAIELTKRIENVEGVSTRVTKLAESLDIPRHDHKAGMLFLRIKIESLLREIALKSNLPPHYQRGSMRRLTSALFTEGIIDASVASAIEDLSPGLNKELHEAVSYLSQNEFDQLVRLGLTIVAFLEETIEKIGSKSV